MLKKARDQLVKQSKRATLMEMVYQSETNEFKDDEKFSDDDLITQLEIQNLIESGNYREAIFKGRSVLRDIISPAPKRRILTLIIQAHRYLGELNDAVSVADELILFQSHNPANYLLKSDLLSDRSQKMDAVEKAIEVNPYFARSYCEKAILYIQEARSSYGDARKSVIDVAHEAVKNGLLRDPSIHNPCWTLKFNLIREFQRDKQVGDAELNEIIQQLSDMNPNSFRVLRMRQQMLSEGDELELEALLEDIDKIKQRSDPGLHPQLDIIRLRSIATSNNTERIGSALSSVISEHDLMKNTALALVVAELKREKLGRDNEAIILMENCLKAGFDDDVAQFLIETFIDLGCQTEAEEAFKKWRHRLAPSVSFRLHIDILEGLNDFDSILTELRRYGALYKTYHGHRMYVLLRKGANEEAKNFGKEVLTSLNFSVEAAAEIINYELARKRLGSKVNTERLEKVLQFANDSPTKAAIYALLDNNKEAIEHIKKEIKKDKTFRFTAGRWPVFERIRTNPDFQQAISLLTQAPVNLTRNIENITKISAHA